MEGTLIANTAALRILVPPLSALRPKAGTENAETRLVQRAKDRWPSAWVEIYDAHYSRLYVYCFARTGNRAMAAKLASRVFLQAVQEIDRYVHWSGRSLFAWLYRLARSEVNDHVDRQDDGAMGEDGELLRAMRSLPREQQEIIALHYYAGCTTEETATAMERSHQFVQHERSRALHRLFGLPQPARGAMPEPFATTPRPLAGEGRRPA
jgi:DNA-directed RNA polymerase specialized sigma24 family protein